MKQIPNKMFFSWVETEIANGRSVKFRLKGVSMLPFIRDGKDEVVLSPCSEKDLSPMDVILFRYHEKHLLHRIIRREGDHLFIQGDGSFVAKEECTVDDVIGIVQAIVRPSGKTLSVDSWKWKLQSRIWMNIGIFKTPILHFIHILIRIRRNS